ncbi:helix-turn-helix domain-containing protein [Chroococcidiopsis thermalis]|uniref:helix-turn-helix domain-containing protein n=1 Tax=Chroococcidiopsis thermalis TaxID=54299 RepID=UPI0002F56B08|nr:helix-turn-helix domain-containing protein [Chroococcidiopsis thermalis]
MSGVVKIDIIESVEELKTLLAAQTTAFGKERVQALYLLKTKQVETVQHLAAILGRNRVTVQRWLRSYRSGGLCQLLSQHKSQGRPMVRSAEAIASLKEVQLWFKTVLGVEANYHVVHRLVRDKLNAKLKSSRPRSSEQNQEELNKFKKNCQAFCKQ